MKSMTGYGRAKYPGTEFYLEIEIKSVNGRYLDLKINAPREFGFFETELRRQITHFLHRGSVEVKILFQDHREPEVAVDISRLKKYYQVIKDASETIDTKQDIPLEFLFSEPGMIFTIQSYADDAFLSQILSETLANAIKDVEISLKAEGVKIQKVLLHANEKIRKALDSVEHEIEPFRQELFQKMWSRINEILNNKNLNNLEQRLMQEAAIYVDKYDIQEEISRLKHHLQKFEDTILQEPGDEIGKTLNFITQEMQREANTLGSKFTTSKTFNDILCIKEEVEKCREICQNVT